MSELAREVTLRFAFPDDALALARLAILDSAEMPEGELLVAEVGGELRVALSLTDGSLIADPFHRTVPLIALLRERAQQLSGVRKRARRRGSATRRALRRPQRARLRA